MFEHEDYVEISKKYESCEQVEDDNVQTTEY